VKWHLYYHCNDIKHLTEEELHEMKQAVCIPFVSLFVFLPLQPTVVVFHSPVAGFSLLVFEVS